MDLIKSIQQGVSWLWNQSKSPSLPTHDNKYLPEKPEPAVQEAAVPETPLEKRSLSKVERMVSFLNYYLLKPLNLFQGTLKALSGQTEQVSPGSEAAEAMWNSFSDPNKAYIFIFPNNTPGFMNGSEHAAILIGNTSGYKADNTDSYSSWSFKKEEGLLGPFNVKRNLNSFVGDFEQHGKPEVIEVEHLDIGAMQRMWGLIQLRQKRYNLIGLNCSTVAARILRKGLNREERATAYSPKGFWTPQDLKLLVADINRMKNHCSAEP